MKDTRIPLREMPVGWLLFTMFHAGFVSLYLWVVIASQGFDLGVELVIPIVAWSFCMLAALSASLLSVFFYGDEHISTDGRKVLSFWLLFYSICGYKLRVVYTLGDGRITLTNYFGGNFLAAYKKCITERARKQIMVTACPKGWRIKEPKYKWVVK